MNFIKHVVPQNDALIKLGNKFSFFGKFEPVKLELVYIPHYRFDFEIHDKRFNLLKVSCLCDAISGHFSIIKKDSNDFETENNFELLEPKLNREEAENIAREELFKIELKHHIRNISKKISLIKLINSTDMAIPYWVRYYKKGDKFDIKMIDAITGEKAGLFAKKAFLKGIR